MHRIDSTRRTLAKEGKAREPGEIHSALTRDISMACPLGWQTVRPGEVHLDEHGGKIPSKRNPRVWDRDIPRASVEDLNEDMYLTGTKDNISAMALKEADVPLVPNGNVNVCSVGMGKILINQIDVAINQDQRALYLPDEIDNSLFFAFQTV